MRILIKTKIENQNIQEIFNGFDRNLFSALNPPWVKTEIIRFDGCKTGDKVEFKIHSGFSFQWKGEIIDYQNNPNEIYFVDTGEKLPFFLSSWQHTHRIIKTEMGSEIMDDIQFKSIFILFDFLLFPLFYFQFLYRKPVYKRFFNLKQ